MSPLMYGYYSLFLNILISYNFYKMPKDSGKNFVQKFKTENCFFPVKI